MKQIKVLGVVALALSLGLVACGGKKSSSTCKHTYGDPVVLKAATCTEKGQQKLVCTKCGNEKTEDIKALGHLKPDPLVKQNETNPTCTEAGGYDYTCARCSQPVHETVAALGHDFGEWQVETAATCDEAGLRKRECSRCDEVETETIAALGHDFQPVDAGEPEAGKAKVQLFTCTHGCGKSYLGFRANQVSEASQSHLSFTQPNEKGEVGASFWGRPIGNAIALDSTGTSVAKQVDETVYCSTETGDFFEYIFDLTQDQIDQSNLDNCRLYLDAKPADYMNGGDFFAYVGGNTDDWTPGFYIDGADDHIEKDGEGNPVMVKDHARPVRAEDGSEAEGVELETEVAMGKRITDYRYILYVDDEVQAFEQGVSNPTHGNGANMTREEFCLPFVFHLHAGENRIRLGMAGGYRSTFYNFTFRPVEEGGQDTPVEPAAPTWPADNPMPIDTSAWTAGTPAQNSYGKSYTPLTSAEGKNGAKIAIGDIDPTNSKGSFSGDGKLNPQNEAGNPVIYKVKVAQAGLYQMIMKGKVSSSSGTDANFNSRSVKVTVNGWASQANTYGTRLYGDAGMNTSTQVPFVVALVNLTGNEDVITLENPNYRIVFDMSSDVIFAQI